MYITTYRAMAPRHWSSWPLPADTNGATTVPGMWVAGNVSDLSGQVITSAAAGLKAGAVINFDLITEDTAHAVAPGGLLLIVEHAPVAPWSWNPDAHTRFPTPEEVLAVLNLNTEKWRPERVEAPTRQAVGPNGQSGIVTPTGTSRCRYAGWTILPFI